jgi:hypothetical protein
MDIEDDFNLSKLIIKSVEIQIQDNEPAVTKKTFERLVAAGYDEATAKEMIASVIAEEIYLMLKDNRKINEEKFGERLAELK